MKLAWTLSDTATDRERDRERETNEREIVTKE
jgi:hypothetical protein